MFINKQSNVGSFNPLSDRYYIFVPISGGKVFPNNPKEIFTADYLAGETQPEDGEGSIPQPFASPEKGTSYSFSICNVDSRQPYLRISAVYAGKDINAIGNSLYIVSLMDAQGRHVGYLPGYGGGIWLLPSGTGSPFGSIEDIIRALIYTFDKYNGVPTVPLGNLYRPMGYYKVTVTDEQGHHIFVDELGIRIFRAIKKSGGSPDNLTVLQGDATIMFSTQQGETKKIDILNYSGPEGLPNYSYIIIRLKGNPTVDYMKPFLPELDILTFYSNGVFLLITNPSSGKLAVGRSPEQILSTFVSLGGSSKFFPTQAYTADKYIESILKNNQYQGTVLYQVITESNNR